MLDQKIETQSELEYAIFELNGQHVAINLEFLERFNLVTEIIKIPRAPKFVLGVIRIEKAIIPLIDLEILLGKNDVDLDNSIALVISLKENIFAIHINNIPKVTKFDEEVKEGGIRLNFPSEWAVGYLESEGTIIPVIDPNLFWIAMGDNEIVGPSLTYNIGHNEEELEMPTKLQDEVDDTEEDSEDEEETDDSSDSSDNEDEE